MRRRLRFQDLEQRQLLAGDFGHAAESPAVIEAEVSSLPSRAAEGEQTADLVAFAQALGDAGVTFYGADWCPACTAQKQLFEDGGNELPFVEVTNPDRTLNQIGLDEEVFAFPTWEFPDGTREEGILSLLTLSERSGVAIPQGDTPTFEAIGNQTVQIGSPLHIPVDAYDPDGQPLTVTVTVDDPSLLEATVIEGNRSIRIDMETYGDMLFELFEQRVPITTGRLIALAEAGFYDDIIFHRILPTFVIQAGDPTGTGTSGSSLGNFDDEFHPDLQHNRSGVLSFAKAGDDTNNSQFFIADDAVRFLDFNHAVFGQLVEGDAVREAISQHDRNQSDRPTIPIEIRTIDVFDDNENSVVMFKPSGDATGSTRVTITVTDADGNAHSEVIDVDVVEDTANSQPFLNELPSTVTSVVNTEARLQLTSTDIEGDVVSYFATIRSSSSSGTVSVDEVTGLVTVTPAQDFIGSINVDVGVQPGPGVFGNSSTDHDTQRVTFVFGDQDEPEIASIDLLASSDSGLRDDDNLTNQATLIFVVDGAADGATVELLVGDVVLGSATGTGQPIAVTTSLISGLGDGSYEVIARQSSGDNSEELARMTVVFDSTAPAPVIDPDLQRQTDGGTYREDLQSDEEGNGLRYSLTVAPASATIDAETGRIEWTPTVESGTQAFVLELTDAAGNVSVETFSVDVSVVSADEVLEIRLEAVDAEGNGIATIDVGDSFWIRMLAVDLRSQFDRAGVFSAHADIMFDNDLIRVAPDAEITFNDPFIVNQRGSFETGLIDELGAAANEVEPTLLEVSWIASVPMVAVSQGTVGIQSDAADDIESETLMFGIDDKISPSRIRFGAATLQIVSSQHRQENPNDVNGDGEVTASDALAILNVMNRADGAFLVSSADPDLLDPEKKYDVVPDGRISPLDALRVINALNTEDPPAESESVDPIQRRIDPATFQEPSTRGEEQRFVSWQVRRNPVWHGLRGDDSRPNLVDSQLQQRDVDQTVDIAVVDPRLADQLMAEFDPGWIEAER